MAQQPVIKKTSARDLLPGLLPNLIINALFPFLIYQGLKTFTHVSELIALFLSATPAIISSIIEVIRARRIDFIAGITLLSIAVSIVAVLLGGDPKLFLIRESLLTVVLGVICLLSLLLPRPAWFYILQYVSSANIKEKATDFDRAWNDASFRRFTRILTLIWGVTWTGEFLLRIYLVYHMSIPQFLLISPFIFYGITFAVIVLSFIYGNKIRQYFAERKRLREQTEREQAVLQSEKPQVEI